jgi:hypothetical protein
VSACAVANRVERAVIADANAKMPQLRSDDGRLSCRQDSTRKSLGLTIANDFFGLRTLLSRMRKPVQTLGRHRGEMLSELNNIFQLFFNAFSG